MDYSKKPQKTLKDLESIKTHSIQIIKRPRTFGRVQINKVWIRRK